MRYIEKHFDAPVVVRHEKELVAAGLDEASIAARNASGEKQDDLYRQVRSRKIIPHWRQLQDLLNEEQGGVCCYCGAKLFYPDTEHYSVEHVRPRSLWPELVGEYKNLLLSCHLNDSEHADIKKNVPKKDRQNMFHCDEHKADCSLHYTPLQADCGRHFSYKMDGSVKGDCADAETDIATLNIDCKSLRTRRREQMLAYLYVDTDDGPKLLDDSSLIAFRQAVERRDADGNYCEFYFVVADVIDQLFLKK